MGKVIKILLEFCWAAREKLKESLSIRFLSAYHMRSRTNTQFAHPYCSENIR